MIEISENYIKEKIWNCIKNDDDFVYQVTSVLKEKLPDLFKELGFQEKYIDTESVCKLLHCSPATLAKYRREGLPYIKSSPNRYFASEVLKWYKENKQMRRKVCHR